ncbi:MAG TPA: glutaredoxin family protein [Bryobacteraceae bacterium]|nr:glutaredoxin family protein [Bryobacteraceae bacterium]
MKQQCHISMIYLSWAFYLGGLAALAWYSRWLFGAAWLVMVPAAQWLYIRKFPSLSAGMGYGPITDQPAAALPPAPVKVTLYTALGCPFCPLLEQRLDTLRKNMNFSLEKIDVTLRPDLLASKGIRCVPVVEVNGRFLTGLISTRDLVEAVGRPVPQPYAEGKPAR